MPRSLVIVKPQGESVSEVTSALTKIIVSGESPKVGEIDGTARAVYELQHDDDFSEEFGDQFKQNFQGRGHTFSSCDPDDSTGRCSGRNAVSMGLDEPVHDFRDILDAAEGA